MNMAETLWAWVTRYPDGSIGTIAATLTPDGVRILTLIGYLVQSVQRTRRLVLRRLKFIACLSGYHPRELDMSNHPAAATDEDIVVRLRRAYDETGNSLLKDALTEIAALRRFVDGTIAKTVERKPKMRFLCLEHGDFENSRGRTAYCPTCERICQRLICDTHDGGCDSPNLCSHENRCQNPFATTDGVNG